MRVLWLLPVPILILTLSSQQSLTQTPPTITAVDPTQGAPGTAITISGTGFNPTAGLNIVHFGAVATTPVTIASGGNALVTVPFGATHQPVTWTTGGRTGYSHPMFLPTFAGGGGITRASFAMPVTFNTGGPAYRGTIADLDGDGKPDLAVGGTSSVSIFRNLSTPGSINSTSFSGPTEFPSGSLPQQVVAADLDGDGDLDLATANRSDGTVTVLRNGSLPGLLSFARADIPQALGFLQGIAVQDIDKDGRPDIVVSGFPVRVGVLRNISSTDTISFAPAVEPVTDGGFYEIAIGDIDGDGKPDLVGAKATEPNMDGFLALFRNLSSPGSVSFAGSVTVAAGRRFPRSITLGDIDGDAKLDVVLSSGQEYLVYPKSLGVFRNTSVPGSISLAPPLNIDTHDRGGAWSVTLADLDGDGHADIVAPIDSAGLAIVYRNISTPGNLVVEARVEFSSGLWPVGVAVGDLDLDGKPDLALSLDHGNGMAVHRNTIGEVIPPPQSAWSAWITVRDSCGRIDTLEFGQDASATDGIDPHLGEAELPPVPPAGALDARFRLPGTPPPESLRDVRSDSLNFITWSLLFQGCRHPFTFHWDRTRFPEGLVVLRDPYGGTLLSVDMTAQDSAVVSNPALGLIEIVFTRQVCRQILVTEGWNMVSVPVQLADMTVHGAFDSSVSLAYRFHQASGYVADSLLDPGTGYWVKFGSSIAFSRCGDAFGLNGMSLNAGWNLIGPFERPVPTWQITTVPPGILSSLFYGYRDGYQIAETLRAGGAYWIRALLPGTMQFHGGFSHPVAEQSTHERWVEVLIQDAAGRSTTLSLAPPEMAAGFGVAPPMPPEGAPDVRFTGNAMVASLEPGMYGIVTRAQTYPLTIVTRNVGENDLLLHIGGAGAFRLHEGTPVVIASPGPLVLAVGEQANALPARFRLAQNYPNPFNPSTRICFDLPFASDVSLVVFDLLGRNVATLVSGWLPAGSHEVVWQAEARASGIYFCHLRAAGMEQVRRMVLMR